VAVVIWNGIVSSMPEMYLYAHELAHVIDGDPELEQLSQSPEWMNCWKRERDDIANKIFDAERRERIVDRRSEAFATALALGLIKEDYLRTPHQLTYQFLKRHRLL